MAKYIEANEILRVFREQLPEELLADLIRATVTRIVETARNRELREVKHGEWLPAGLDRRMDENNNTVFLIKQKCSLCGEFMDGITNFCPRCGAQMVDDEYLENCDD